MCTAPKPPKKQFCGAKWEYSLIKQILAPNTSSHAANIDDEHQYHKLAKLELLSARNKIENDCNIQKCPECETLYFQNNDSMELLGQITNKNDLERIFKTKCVLCRNNTSFCWGCGEKWDDGHICDSSFRSELVDILSKAETKKIGDVDGVPEIRCCPNCCQLITHTEACKHMKCKACKTDFCFVCLKSKKNGNWQCGNSGTVCPIADRQNMVTLPDNIVINKKSLKLF